MDHRPPADLIAVAVFHASTAPRSKYNRWFTHRGRGNPSAISRSQRARVLREMPSSAANSGAGIHERCSKAAAARTASAAPPLGIGIVCNVATYVAVDTGHEDGSKIIADK
jgi:hypothetical protein